MSGRIEKENKLKLETQTKLKSMPKIFESFYFYLEADGKSYSTIDHYIEYVYDMCKFLNPTSIADNFYENITTADLRSYIASIRRKSVNNVEVRNGDSIQCTRYSGLSTFFKFLVVDEYIKINPMERTRRPKMRDQHDVVYLTSDETAQIMQNIERNSSEKMRSRDKAIISLALSTALRVAAITAIDISDINFETMTIHVIEKENKDRYISFGENLKTILYAWIKDRNKYFNVKDTDALFVSNANKRITDEGVRLLTKKYASGLSKNISPHTFRKSAAMRMLENGVDVVTVSKMLGHESLEVTKHYVDALKKNKENAVHILDTLL